MSMKLFFKHFLLRELNLNPPFPKPLKMSPWPLGQLPQYSQLPISFTRGGDTIYKHDINKIEFQVEFNISNVEFYLKIYIKFDFEDIDFFTKLNFVEIEF